MIITISGIIDDAGRPKNAPNALFSVRKAKKTKKQVSPSWSSSSSDDIPFLGGERNIWAHRNALKFTKIGPDRGGGGIQQEEEEEEEVERGIWRWYVNWMWCVCHLWACVCSQANAVNYVVYIGGGQSGLGSEPPRRATELAELWFRTHRSSSIWTWLCLTYQVN